MNILKLSKDRFVDFDSKTFFTVAPNGHVTLSTNVPTIWEFIDHDAANLVTWLEANATTPTADQKAKS